MPTVVFYTADGRKAGEETYDTIREAQAAARKFVSREGLNSYKTIRGTHQTRYYHSYGEREAIVVA